MVSNNMNNISFGAVSSYLGMKGLTPEEIHDYTMLALRGDATSYNMVKKWDAEFKRDRVSLEDEPRRRKPVTVTTQETIANINDIITADRRVMEYCIPTELGTSQDHIHAVTHNEHHKAKV